MGWISRDPIGEADGALYQYVHNNPIGFVDPLGLCACKCNSVSVTLTPAGGRLGTYYVLGGLRKFGALITVDYDVTGESDECEYTQSESGSGGYSDPRIRTTWIVPKTVPTPRHYDDALGFYIPTGFRYAGNYQVWIALNIALKCEGTDGSTAEQTVTFNERRYIHVPVIGDATDVFPGYP
jgi:hypothetical protein